MPRAEAEIGSTANSYEILAKLATGGMAEIFLARGASVAGVERYVVLKRVLRERATDLHFIKMFLDEARLAAQLQHPNIAQVYDIGKLGDSYFFTMEYVHGETVRALLQRAHALRRVIPINAVLAVAAGAAAGLHHAHDRIGIDGKPLGIVHRDVSPSNLMISYEGNVKVVDFGVAKAAHRTQETRSGTVKGKIAYLSPEQCRGREIDRRSDLFSLGIVMWEMLTTERLFKLGSDFETMQAIVAETVAPPSTRRTDVPPELDALVLRLLAKTPEERFQSADEVLESIETCAVRTATALSMASLGRFVRELFGQRPEPWLELQSTETHSEVVTVTSEPIPPDLGLAAVVSLDSKLAKVPEPRPNSPSKSPLPQTPRLTAATVVEAGRGKVPVDMDGMPTLPLPAIAPTGPSQTPTTPDGMASLISTHQSAVPPMPRTPPGGNIPPPLAPPPPAVAASSGGFGAAESIAYPVVQQPPPATPRVPLVVWIVAPAIAVGFLIGLVLAIGGGRDVPRTKLRVASAEPAVADAAMPQLAPPVVAIDAAPAAPPPAIAEAAVAVQVPVAAAPDVPASNDTAPPAHAHSRTPKPKPVDLKELMRASKYAEVVTECSGSSALASQNPVVCTLAACHTHETAKAKKWFAQVAPEKHQLTATGCAQAGTLVETPKPAPPAPDDDCKRDPMACQH